MSRQEALFLVNPASGNGATGRGWPRHSARAAELGLRGETLLSERPGHLAELAAQAAGDGRLLVVVGGDGTLNEVVNGVAGTGAEIAVVPAGTGRDFGRTYGIPRRFDDAVAVALGGTTRTVDLGKAAFTRSDGSRGERLFANAASVGMSGAVAKRANSMSKRLGGRVTFYRALVREFATWRNTDLRVSFAGGERSGPMHDAIVANGRFLGGGMMLAPAASPDDGLFDVVLVGDIGKLDFITTSPKLYRGGHVGHPRVEIVRSAWVEIDATTPMLLELDGEQEGVTPVRFETLAGALRLRVPG